MTWQPAVLGWASQQLADGSWLVLDRVSVGSRVVFTHGTRIEKLLGDLIPAKGVHLLGINLVRRTREHFDSGPSHRSLDPRFVWRLDADFEPVSGFLPEQLANVRLPPRGSTFTTNLM